MSLTMNKPEVGSAGVQHINGTTIKVPRRLPTVSVTNAQLMRLEHEFQRNSYLPTWWRKEVAVSLGLTERDVKRWFKKRRSKLRQEIRASLLPLKLKL